jgi:hypothetical protein
MYITSSNALHMQWLISKCPHEANIPHTTYPAVKAELLNASLPSLDSGNCLHKTSSRNTSDDRSISVAHMAKEKDIKANTGKAGQQVTHSRHTNTHSLG